MSAYGEWKAGFITEYEYRKIMWEEEMRDRYYMEPDEEDCEEDEED